MTSSCGPSWMKLFALKFNWQIFSGGSASGFWLENKTYGTYTFNLKFYLI